MSPLTFDLSGRTALVTGARRGIGRAAAVALAAAGADIVGASVSPAHDDEVGAEVERHGRSFRSYRCDFADRQAVYGLVADLRRDVGDVDILVNNAGTIARVPAAEHPDDLWDRVLEVNLSAQFVLARELGGRMLVRGGGKIDISRGCAGSLLSIIAAQFIGSLSHPQRLASELA